MRRMLFLSVVLCLVCLFPVSAQEKIRVFEREIKAALQPNQLAVNFALENSGAKLQANIRMEILDAEEGVVAQGEQAETFKSGKQTFQIPVQFTQNYSSNLLWHRLRYSVISIETPNQLLAAGIVSLSEIMPEIFELRAAGADNVFPGMSYRVRVRTFHPVTNLPMANVKISGEVSLELDTDADEDELKLVAAGTTGSSGYAVLNFTIPAGAKLDSYGGWIKLTGVKNEIRREARQNLDALEMQNSVYLNTDKPIYQPNQNFHVRGLLLTQNFNSLKAAAEKELKFIIEDEDDTVLYRETVKTSRFGVAAINWKIPENAKLGTYKVRVENDEAEQMGSQIFRVSRYELPNFTVTAKPGKTFYLPTETLAEISVSAEYLFGKPVSKGKVKIVREKDRRWNYREQKWETEEEKPYEGETDADGKFIAKVDLSEAHKNLRDSDYRRFEDLRFAAYFTDSTSNRTEQRRFDVRVTKEAVHVYVIGINSYDDHNPKLPFRFYVSTFYADGSPAACNVEVRGKYEDEQETESKTLAQLKTNAYGAGRIEFVAPRRAAGIYDEDLQIKISASDEKNQNGTHEEEFELDEDAKAVQATSKRAIYKAGEPIELEVFSTEPEADVFVDVVKDWSVVESSLVKTKSGKASLKIPYRVDFKGELGISAYLDDGGKAVKNTIGVIYPSPVNLRLDVEPAQTVYRPNEEAKIKFNVASPDKNSAESALGIVVFDKAIEERARTDADFGGVNLYGNFSRLLQSKNFGAITLNAINEMDLRRKIPDELQLIAEIILAETNYYPRFFESGDYDTDLTKIFGSHFRNQFLPIEALLKEKQAKNFEHPVDDSSLKRILSEIEIDFESLRDPWGEKYRAVFTIEGENDVLTVWSAGVNKIFDRDKTGGRRDDLLVLQMRFRYFTGVGQAIDQAIFEYRQKMGAFVRDYAALKNALKLRNIDLDALRDRWNQPYKISFGVSGRMLTIDYRSGGANGKLDADYLDDFTIWTNRTDYFKEIETQIQTILSVYLSEKKIFPKSEDEFREILKRNGIDFGSIRDAWHRPVTLGFTTFSRYSDRVKTEVIAKYGETHQEKMTITPVTQQVAVFKVLTLGADGAQNTYDDTTLATFSGVIAEQNKDDAKPVEIKTEVSFTGGRGAIRGIITDSTGAVIPNATVTATNEESNAVSSVTSGENGLYFFKSLPIGKYTIRTEAAGFQSYVVTNVAVLSAKLIELNFSLSIGSVSSVVEVTAAADVTVSTSSSIVETRQIESLPLNGKNVSSLLKLKPGTTDSEKGKAQINVPVENSTPRLREYFPETLVWQPELITDKKGRAELKFKLGDNITTWKLYTIASNAEGKIGIAERKIKAFQPFFVDLEPPKVLTVGDEIALPVQIRNYIDKLQKVNVTMADAGWFNFLKQSNHQIEVLPNATENAIFDFRVNSAVKEGKQRVTAIADKDSDAIEKPIRVFPNGQEIVGAQSELFRESVSFDVNFPNNALPETARAELKIYPNLLAHVAESVEGILQRPYGCGEQTISSTYPNLMILKTAKNAPFAPKLQTQAQKFLQQGYERLLGYQQPDGGFSVWAKDASDVALTAYAIRFLDDASEFIEVDDDAVSRARKWLLSQQRADGSWTRIYSWEKTEDRQRTKIFTTYVTRILAMTEKDKKEKSKELQASLKRAFEYLKTRNAEIDEPYALASFALALFDAGETETAQKIVEKLRALAITEGNTAYWKLETNTPFYGWGTAGRIETTALAVQALIEGKRQKEKGKSEDQSSKIEDQNLISRGTMFLLKNKDKYGVWYSTQATINVLDALLASLSSDGQTNDRTRLAEIYINNQKFKDVALPPSNALAFPINVDLPVTANVNRVEVRIGGSSSMTMAQIVQNHYISWQDAVQADGRDTNQSRQLKLDYKCDKTDAKIAEEISCTVEAERIGFKGYGMLLAEIGLPPGADVSRESLEKAKADNWNFSRYDVLPDRIVIYMWAQAGGTRLNFKFRPRYGIYAQTASSIVYDYYNPEAQATLPPLKFNVK